LTMWNVEEILVFGPEVVVRGLGNSPVCD